MTRGVPRSSWSWSGFAVLALGLGVASVAITGCRSCADDHATPAADSGPPQPPMPAGMLMGSDGAATTIGTGPDAGGARVARGMKSGAWTELQIARSGDGPDRTEFEHWRDDSWFVSLEAMMQLHEAFARALPGFDLFLPRLFEPRALVLLGGELEAVASRSTGDLAGAARELAVIARSTAAKGQSLWVVGL
jgi:hypothetical protein